MIPEIKKQIPEIKAKRFSYRDEKIYHNALKMALKEAGFKYETEGEEYKVTSGGD